MKRLALLAVLAAFSARADKATVAVRGGSAYVSGQLDRDRWAATAGVEGLYRHGWLLVGGSFDASSRITSVSSGAVRHLFFAGEFGTSVVLLPRLRLDLIGELGGHRISGSRSGPFRVSPDSEADVYLASEPAWAPFAGLRPSVQVLFHEQIALGLGAWARSDLLEMNPLPWLDPALGAAQTQRVALGRFSAGADVHLAVRFE